MKNLDPLFRSLRHRFRRRRYEELHQRMILDSVSGFILDLGGGPDSFFVVHHPYPRQIILLDIDSGLALQAREHNPRLNVVIANGEHLPFAFEAIHLTVCNSVIEHVASPNRLAAEIQRVSRSYFVQTPNPRFPVETHSFIGIPFYRLIPWIWLRRLVCRLFRADYDYVASVRYLAEDRLRALFPGATLQYEKFIGLNKSFYLTHSARSKTRLNT